MKFRFMPEARRATVGYVATVKVQDCKTGRIVLSSKCSTDEFSTEAKALRFAEQAASVVAWNMNAQRDGNATADRFRLLPCKA